MSPCYLLHSGYAHQRFGRIFHLHIQGYLLSTCFILIMITDVSEEHIVSTFLVVILLSALCWFPAWLLRRLKYV
jgi:hypothetical protein